jgi:hypothetical protein
MAELPKIVVRRLRDDSAVRAVHPDPNLVNAFVENSLPDNARAQVVQHIAQCADCREVVFLSLPDQSAMQPAMASVTTRWLTWPVLRWGAAVAAVVVVGAAISLHRPSAGNSRSSGPFQQRDAPMWRRLRQQWSQTVRRAIWGRTQIRLRSKVREWLPRRCLR